MTAFGHFSAGYVGYAAQAGVPAPGLLVPLSGVIAILGGLSITLGYKAKIGGWLIVLFLVPVTLKMHAFWAVPDPMMHGIQLAMFWKNVSMLGAVRLHGAPVHEFGVGRGLRAGEELLQPVHGEVQVEGVHVACEDVDPALELGPEPRPVPRQILAQVVVVGAEVLGHAAVDRSAAQVPQLGRVAVRRDRTVRRLPDRELLA